MKKTIDLVDDIIENDELPIGMKLRLIDTLSGNKDSHKTSFEVGNYSYNYSY